MLNTCVEHVNARCNIHNTCLQHSECVDATCLNINAKCLSVHAICLMHATCLMHEWNMLNACMEHA